ncbi:MAG TPA: phage baseplate assembly protein V [Actinocrinis sp.]
MTGAEPSVTVGGSPLAAMLLQQLHQISVETHLHLPGMFELAFVGVTDDDLTTGGVTVGAQIVIEASDSGPDGDGGQSTQLIKGEVTAFEGHYDDYTGMTTVRGYDVGHRLQRLRRTRAFVNMSDSDVAQQIASDAGLDVGDITPTDVVHDHLPQYDQTDWEFLKQRASEIGYEIAVEDGKFGFRKASSIDGAGGQPYQLSLNDNLKSFSPRITAGNLTPNVEVRVWDPLQAKVVSAVSGATTGSVSDPGQTTPESVADAFGGNSGGGDPAPSPSPVSDQLGPPPSSTAFVLHRPVGSGSTADSAATAMAGGLNEHRASTFGEAEGYALGAPGIQAGKPVQIAGLSSQFPATWMVTRAQHVFRLKEGGYRTEFAASGRHDRSLLGLTSLGGTQATQASVPGVMCGVVTNINGTNARVKVTLPVLSPDYESDWAPVVQAGAGPRSGALYMPEVGDQVLVGFESGDPRRPYVIGGIIDNRSKYTLGGDAVQATGESAAVVRRGFVSASGNMLAFHDEMPPGDGAKPTQSQIALGTSDGSVGLAIDVVQGTVVISCAPQSPGQITIKCSDAGTVNIQAGEGGTMTIDGGDNLTIKAQTSLNIQSSGTLALKGTSITLN